MTRLSFSLENRTDLSDNSFLAEFQRGKGGDASALIQKAEKLISGNQPLQYTFTIGGVDVTDIQDFEHYEQQDGKFVIDDLVNGVTLEVEMDEEDEEFVVSVSIP